MDSYIFALFSFGVAFLITFASVPFIRVIAFKFGAVDVPTDKRRMHSTPIPRAGGLAIFYGFVISVLCFTRIIDEKMIGILLGGFVIVMIGFLDDIYKVNAFAKLGGQIVAALIPVLFGVRIVFFTNPNIFVPDPLLLLNDYFSIPITVIWIVAITNAVNLIDGLDGLAASVAGIAATSLIFVAITLNQIQIAIVLAAIAGSCFGFLPFNLNPAKIFMGDTGALFLGYILAAISIEGFFKSYTFISFAIPIIVLGFPIFDVGFAIFRRLSKGKAIMAPDREHMHHRLIDMGFNQRQAVGILSTITGILSLAAITLTTRGLNRTLVLVFAAVLFIIGTKLYVKYRYLEEKYLKDFHDGKK